MAEATFKTTPSINDALVIAAADMHPNWEVLSDGGIRMVEGIANTGSPRKVV
jgi:hypothetical protein